MKLILLGAPGAGKGTQAEKICEKLNIPAIGTGNIIREQMSLETPVGIIARGFVDGGNLVPDPLVIEILAARLTRPDCADGYVLDGFPRNVEQAMALENMGEIIDKVIDIEVDDKVIISRLEGRRICQSCGASYHTIYNPPRVEGVCDKCSAKLVVRVDDAPSTVEARLRVYHKITEPLKEYYYSTGRLYIVHGHEDMAETTRRTLQAVEDV